MPIKLAHFSDIHVTAERTGWRAGDFLSKRVTTWANHRLLGRGRRFRLTEAILAALRADLAGRRPDHLVFSGDATAMGFESEVARAAELLPLSRPGLAVPGNHDYCTAAAMRCGAFERHFAPWQAGQRVDGATYPFAQDASGAWLVAVNSAVANRLPWDARGRVGRPQLDRLRELLARLDRRPRILVTHYPIARGCGRPEGRMHGLRDLPELIAVAREGGVGLWLHGHQHGAYGHALSDALPIPSICAGSATQVGRWSYGEYAVEGTRLSALRRVYDPAAGRFRDGEAFEVVLRRPGA